jgi:acetyl esterase
MKTHYKLHWKTRLLDKILNSSKPLEQMSLDELSETAEKSISPITKRIFGGKKISVNKIVQQNINGRHGDISIQLYYPSQQKSLPLILFFHGGGWVYGNFDTYDYFCRRLTKDTGAIVLTVDYRLAPFYKYPTALEDCYDAYLWTVENATNLSANPEKIIVMG